MRDYIFFVSGPTKVHQIFSPNVGEDVVDMCFNCLVYPFPEIFTITVESCQKSDRTGEIPSDFERDEVLDKIITLYRCLC